jgi:hypothetical protein
MEAWKLKDIINIKIDNEPFTCFVMQEGKIFVEEKISKFFNADYDKGTIASMGTVKTKIEGKSVFPSKVVINNLRLRILKQLAEDGLFHRVNKAVEVKNNPKERVLSDFDRMMLKAVNYNHREIE